jgi:hypothetical protein
MYRENDRLVPGRRFSLPGIIWAVADVSSVHLEMRKLRYDWKSPVHPRVRTLRVEACNRDLPCKQDAGAGSGVRENEKSNEAPWVRIPGLFNYLANPFREDREGTQYV